MIYRNFLEYEKWFMEFLKNIIDGHGRAGPRVYCTKGRLNGLLFMCVGTGLGLGSKSRLFSFPYAEKGVADGPSPRAEGAEEAADWALIGQARPGQLDLVKLTWLPRRGAGGGI
jgi:hypothetical protein